MKTLSKYTSLSRLLRNLPNSLTNVKNMLYCKMLNWIAAIEINHNNYNSSIKFRMECKSLDAVLPLILMPQYNSHCIYCCCKKLQFSLLGCECSLKCWCCIIAELGVTPKWSDIIKCRIAQHIESITMTIVHILDCTVVKDSVIYPGTGVDDMKTRVIQEIPHICKCILKCLI